MSNLSKTFAVCLVLSSLLTIVAPAPAEDLNVPAFAGGNQTGVVFWEFNADTDQPTSQISDPPYYYVPELAEPEFGFRYYGAGGAEFTWNADGGINADGSVNVNGEESVVQKIPSGTGANITAQVQITYKGTTGEPWGMELWAGYLNEYLGGTEGGAFSNTSENEIALGDGWMHLTWTGTWIGFPQQATHFHMISFEGGGGLELDEVVIDLVIHDGNPPDQPGTRPTIDLRRAKNPNPSNFSEHVDPVTQLSWETIVVSPTYDVYFGTTWPPPLVSAGQGAATYDPPGGMALMTPHYWKIDVWDSGERIQGPQWSFTTGGKAWDPSPADQALGIEIDTALSWSGDSFATSYDVYFGTNPGSLASLGNFINTSVPNGSLGGLDELVSYYWRVNERDPNGVIATGDLWEFTMGSDEIYVPANYSTIQDAIDAVWQGGTAFIADGIYTGNGNRDLDFRGKAITVRSENGPEGCIIDCQGTSLDYHRGFDFHSGEDENSVLEGFTITNGYHGLGGGIYCGSSSPTLANCIFSGNSADDGGGMHNSGSSPTLTDCTFIGNTAYVDGGGGGMANWDNSSPMLTDCTFSGNSAGADGGGMHNSGSSPTLTNCKFIGNSVIGNVVSGGGGIFNWEGSSLTLTNCVFIDNTSPLYGGAIYNGDAIIPTITNCTFMGNSADVAGGGIYFERAYYAFADSILEFSGTQGLDSWYYGYYDGDGPSPYSNDDFDQLPQFGEGQWYFEGYWTSVWNEGGHPNGSPMVHWAVRRWVSEVEGTIRIIGDLAKIDDSCGDGITGHILVDGNDVWSQYIAYDNTIGVSYSVDVAVNINSLVDFVIDLNGEDSCDGSRFTAAIRQVTPPTTISNCILWGNTAPQGPQVGLADSTIGFTYCDLQGGEPAVYADSNSILDWGDGNITDDPLFETDNYHLQVSSPCINTGDPNGNYAGQTDIDGEQRVYNDRVDMGADEFYPPVYNVTQDLYFYTIQDAINAAQNGNTLLVRDGIYTGVGNKNIDFGGLAITLQSRGGAENCIIDCENSGRGFIFQNSETSASVVDGFTTTDANSGDYGGGIYCDSSSPTVTNCTFSGNSAGINGGGMFNYSSSPTVTNCNFSGNLTDEFGGGMSNWGSSPTVTNCTFGSNLAGNGGGGMFNSSSSNPTVTNCTFSGNSAANFGGGMYNVLSSPTISDCTISNNSPDGIWINDTSAPVIAGTVQVISNDLTGAGSVQLQPTGTMEVQDSGISCDVSGTGVVAVPFGKEVILKGNATVDLSHETDPNLDGEIACNGLLRVKDSATIMNTPIFVVRASFEDTAAIIDNIISVEPGAPYGQFAVKDAAAITGNDIYANGDRYLDVDPNTSTITNEDNLFFITITEGSNDTPAGLFEARGRDFNEPPVCSEFACQVAPGTIPDSNMVTWTIEEIVLVAEAKAIVTNRSDYQPPYDSGGEEEVIYVRQLVLGPNSILYTGFNQLYYEEIDMDPTAQIVSEPFLGFSLDEIDFDDEDEFENRVTENNFINPENPEYTRIHVELVEDPVSADPCSVMKMANFVDDDPCSASYGQTYNARAKGLFAKASEDEILIRFKYLFGTSTPGTELAVYLSDVPELLDYDDPGRDEHYTEVSRLPAPPVPRPGSAGSDSFGEFQEFVSRGGLDLTEGVWVELELFQPPAGAPLMMGGNLMASASASSENAWALVNNWDPQVHCSGICMDITDDNIVNEADFLKVVGGCGNSAELLPNGTNSRLCLDLGFSSDGYVDSYDIVSWDWSLNPDGRKNLCGVPLVGSLMEGGGGSGATITAGDIDALLIVGKRDTTNGPGKLKDKLYVFDELGQYADSFSSEPQRSGIKVVRGPEGELYQINSEKGVYPLSDPNDAVIPPGQDTYANDPRYGGSAVVYVGFQGTGGTSVGRPILDAAFDADGFAYVVPVVVEPDDSDPNTVAYLAAAKLQLLGGGNYNVVWLYDDPPLTDDNQYRNALREIEFDRDGNVYVVNTHNVNQSDILWKFRPNESSERLDLGDSEGTIYIPGPIGMHMSSTTDMLYLASSQYNPADADSTVVYGFSTEPSLVLARSVTINGMQHVTSITEDPDSGSLWVAGFNMDVEIPAYPIMTESPFYYPYLAQIPYTSDDPVLAVSLSDANDLALPLSVVWTKQVKCGGADVDGLGDVGLTDVAVLAAHWLDMNCTPPLWCEWADVDKSHVVDMVDFAAIGKHWSETGCLD